MNATLKVAQGWMQVAGTLDRQGERGLRNEALKQAAEHYYQAGWVAAAEMAERLLAAPIGASRA